jgi:hypothetical protein
MSRLVVWQFSRSSSQQSIGTWVSKILFFYLLFSPFSFLSRTHVSPWNI